MWNSMDSICLSFSNSSWCSPHDYSGLHFVSGRYIKVDVTGKAWSDDDDDDNDDDDDGDDDDDHVDVMMMMMMMMMMIIM